MTRGGLIAIGALLAPSAYVLGIALPRFEIGRGLPSQDFYGYRAPLLVTLKRSVDQGFGLLWNDLQSAGQPFLTMPSSGIFYPPTLLVAQFDTTSGTMIWLVLHLALAGGGAALFARELGLRLPATVATLLAVQFGGFLTFFALWGPLILAAFAWLPLILFATERLLRSPTGFATATLGVLLTAQLLSGFPQIMVFSYLLVGLRVAWELATKGVWRSREVAVSAGCALVLPLFLGAVYLLPALEIVSASVRDLPMPEAVVNVVRGGKTWNAAVGLVKGRHALGGFLPVVVFFAGAAIGRAGSRRRVTGYLMIVGLFFALIPDSWLRDLYQSVPVLASLRAPTRFAWVPSLCLCLLAGVGFQALASPRDRRGLWIAIVGLLFAGLLFHVSVPGGLSAKEVALGLAMVAVAGLAWVVPRTQPIATFLLLLGLVLGMWPAISRPQLRLFMGSEETHEARPIFELVAALHTPQDRVLMWPRDRWTEGSLAVLDKSPALYGLPSVSDYEHLVTKRYAGLYVFLARGRFLNSGMPSPLTQANPVQRIRLANLLAARFVVTDRPRGSVPRTLKHLASFKRFHAFENPTALPRAYVVPEARVVEDSRERLRQLARRGHDPRSLVLLSRAPREGGLGESLPEGVAAGRVTFQRAYGESLVLDVSSTRGGFLVLTDQESPGWRVAVNGEPAELLSANHAFRAVRVPPGRSIVTFDYEPTRLWAGMFISGISLLGLVGLGLRRARGIARPGPETFRLGRG